MFRDRVSIDRGFLNSGPSQSSTREKARTRDGKRRGSHVSRRDQCTCCSVTAMAYNIQEAVEDRVLLTIARRKTLREDVLRKLLREDGST